MKVFQVGIFLGACYALALVRDVDRVALMKFGLKIWVKALCISV
jgi:hypothetical protein